MYNKILVPVDGSDHAMKAATHAMEIALTFNSQVTLLYVISDSYNSSRLSEDVRKQLRDTFMEQSCDVVDKVASEVQKPNITIEKKILTGHPAQQILKECVDGEYDLVVMGNRGQSGVKEFVMGSVSKRIADSACAPVLIVR